MSSRLSYQYVVLRCVPRADREEFLNVGVVLYCEAAGFLDVASSLDADRLRTLDPRVDVDQLAEALAFVGWVCAGDDRGGAAASSATKAVTSCWPMAARKECTSLAKPLDPKTTSFMP